MAEPTQGPWWRLTGSRWRVYVGSVAWLFVFVVLVAIGLATGTWLWYQVLLAGVAAVWSVVYISSAVTMNRPSR